MAGAPWDAYYYLTGYQWNLSITQTDKAWQVTQGSPAVRVAVLDTGICAHHPELAGKVDESQSASFVPADYDCPNCAGCPAWEDRHFHGTHVASTISANNIYMAGIAPNVRLRAVKVLNCGGSGMFSWTIEAIMYAVNTGNNVINMSLGGYFPKNMPGAGELVAALNKAVNYAQTAGTLVVSAAQNAGRDLNKDQNYTAVPCQSGSGICVGATNMFDKLAGYSNYGTSGPQIVAPGGDDTQPVQSFIIAACSNHSLWYPECGTYGGYWYLWLAGTSMATPHVSGAAALVSSTARQPGGYRAAQLRDALLSSADDLGAPGTDQIYSHGRLNTYGAVTRKK